MKRIIIPILTFFLLFSLAAQTFSAFAYANKNQVSLVEEENGKDAQKEKDEVKKEDGKDKCFTLHAAQVNPVDASAYYTGFLHPELITRRSDPPEIPPDQA